MLELFLASALSTIVGRVEIGPNVCLTQFLDGGEIIESILPCDESCHPDTLPSQSLWLWQSLDSTSG